MLKSEYIPLEAGSHPRELDAGRIETVGLTDEENGREPAIGSRKAYRKRERMIANDSDKLYETPPKIVDKLRCLQEYCGVDRYD